MNRTFIAFLFAVGCGGILLVFLIVASKPKREIHYQREWCFANGGEIEVALPDRTRVDYCLTDEYAIEFDFARKWAEAPFQALHYARMTGKKPGVVIICRNSKGRNKLDRLRRNLEFYEIEVRVWGIGCED